MMNSGEPITGKDNCCKTGGSLDMEGTGLKSRRILQNRLPAKAALSPT
jgi:hypothetical protein